MRILLLLFFAFSVHAQSFQYRLEGSFTTVATPDPTSPTIVNYSINWNETSNALQGIYQDNYFTQGQPRTVSGTVTPTARSMNIILPQTVSNVRQLTFVTNATGTTSGSVSMNITTRDNIGSVIDNPSTFALVSTLPGASSGAGDPTQECIVGFGALTGMCGIYNGSFAEIRDSNNRCDLLSAGNPRLEFAPNTAFSLILNYIPGAQNTETHTIGTFLPSPQTNSINISGRNCGDLPATSFITGDCKTMNLNGIFIPTPNGDYSFSGTYTITDEVNAESCAYSLNLTRE